jgi:hypothetical protein
MQGKKSRVLRNTNLDKSVKTPTMRKGKHRLYIKSWILLNVAMFPPYMLMYWHTCFLQIITKTPIRKGFVLLGEDGWWCAWAQNTTSVILVPWECAMSDIFTWRENNNSTQNNLLLIVAFDRCCLQFEKDPKADLIHWCLKQCCACISYEWPTFINFHSEYKYQNISTKRLLNSFYPKAIRLMNNK